MLRIKAACPWPLLLLLLVFAGGWAGADARDGAQRVAAEQTLVPPTGAGEECEAVAWTHSCDALRSAGRPAPAAAKAAGDAGGASPHSGKAPDMMLPARLVQHAAHAQAVLKQRLYSLLTHGCWQQRLALYPKHGFW